MILLSAGAIFLSVRFAESQYYYEKSRHIPSDGDLLAKSGFLRKAVELDPTNHDAYAALGKCMLDLEMEFEVQGATPWLDKALRSLRKGLFSVSVPCRVCQQLRELLSEQGRYDEAEKVFMQGIKWGRAWKRIHRAYGLHCLRKGDMEEGIAVLKHYSKMYMNPRSEIQTINDLISRLEKEVGSNSNRSMRSSATIT